MPRVPVEPDGLPIMGSYTPAYKVSNGELILTSGLTGIDAEGRVVGGPEDPGAQAKQLFENLQAVLSHAGASLDDVVQLRIYTTDMRYRDAINVERRKFFKTPLPASTHVQVTRLVHEEWLFEIEAVAFVESPA